MMSLMLQGFSAFASGPGALRDQYFRYKTFPWPESSQETREAGLANICLELAKGSGGSHSQTCLYTLNFVFGVEVGSHFPKEGNL